jgi:hypothetical protein
MKTANSAFANSALRRGDSGVLGFFFERVQPPAWFVTNTFRDYADRYGRLRPPARGRALSQLREYFRELETAAKKRIGYILVLDYGNVSGRLHAHALVSGVGHLDRRVWWEKAYQRFGRTSIEPYEEHGGGAQYIAKHALTETGDLYFGGRLLDPKPIKEPQPVGRVVVAKSADVPSEFFKMGPVRGRRR